MELLGDRLLHHLKTGAGVEDAGVIGHAQGIPLGIDAPIAVAVLLPKVLLGASSSGIGRSELTHASAAADIAGNDRHSRLVNQQAALNGGELTAACLVEDLGHPAIEILELDRVGHATEALEGFANRAHIGEIDFDFNRAAETLIAAEVQQQLVAIHPAAAGVAHLDLNLVAFDAVGGDLLALSSGGDADIADA